VLTLPTRRRTTASETEVDVDEVVDVVEAEALEEEVDETMVEEAEAPEVVVPLIAAADAVADEVGVVAEEASTLVSPRGPALLPHSRGTRSLSIDLIEKTRNVAYMCIQNIA
jgi:hypothetical protein